MADIIGRTFRSWSMGCWESDGEDDDAVDDAAVADDVLADGEGASLLQKWRNLLITKKRFLVIRSTTGK